MRVIGGKYKGKKLFAPEGYAVRPTADKAKGAAFNILRPILPGAVFVDLFSGTGAIGIEALSNGADKVYFCDSDRNALALLEKNLVGIDGGYEILRQDFRNAVDTLAARGVKADAVYADPPYKGGFEHAITAYAQKILPSGGILAVEHGRDTEVPDNGLIRVSDRRYGVTIVSFFRKPNVAVVTGTFDPFTVGHRFLVEKALAEFDKVYVALLVNPDKTMKYPLERRLELAKKSLANFGDRVEVEAYGGLAVDYCKARGASAIVRGFRTEADLAYEKEMADYNRKRSGIPTVLYEADRKEVSSTEVRNRVETGAPAGDYVAKEIEKELAECKITKNC